MKDFLEQQECAAEKRADELFDGRKWKCAGCGCWIEPGKEQPSSCNPYSMPVCLKCFWEDRDA
jgi:hypothetical protein